MSRPLTRLRLVLSKSPAAEALAARIADGLAVHGVQVRQQLQGAPHDGAPRADVALWLPDADGNVGVPDARAAPARVQAALLVEPSGQKALGRYDALVVPCSALKEPVRAALKKSNARDVPVVVARLAGAPLIAREAEKALRGVSGRRVVVVDARVDEAELERIIVQLAFKSQEAALVLLASHDDRARSRVRTLCDRHAVDAWLSSGPDAFALSVAAADLFIGRPSWDEVLLAALHRVALAWLPNEGHDSGLVVALHQLRVVDEVMGLLQLSAALDRRLADAGSLDVRGLALHEALFGADQELTQALAALEPLPQGALASSWEPVGPHAAAAAAAAAGDAREGAVVVDAKESTAPAEPSRAQKIEDALEALKQKMSQA